MNGKDICDLSQVISAKHRKKTGCNCFTCGVHNTPWNESNKCRRQCHNMLAKEIVRLLKPRHIKAVREYLKQHETKANA